jgi:hypothetical protein
MEGNCKDCKHGVTGWSDNNKELQKQGYSKVGNTSPVLGELMVKCNIGHNEENLKWWNDNGRKKGNLDLVSCFDLTDIAISSQKMLDTLDKMINLIDKNKEENG